MDAVVQLLNWVIQNFGALNFIILLAAIYTAYLHQIEVAEHKDTIIYTRALQQQFIEAQLANIKLLSDINNFLHTKLNKYD